MKLNLWVCCSFLLTATFWNVVVHLDRECKIGDSILLSFLLCQTVIALFGGIPVLGEIKKGKKI